MKKMPAFSFLTLARRNLANRPWRNFAAVFAFAIIAGTLFSAQYLMSGASQSLESGLDRMGADIMVVPTEYSAVSQSVLLTGQPSSFFFKDSGFEKIVGLDGVGKASPEIFIGTLYGHSCCSGPVQLIAIDPGRDFTIATWLKENPGVMMGKDDIIVGSSIIGDVGSDLIFYGHTFHIAGRLSRTGLAGVDMAVFTRFEDAFVMADESGQKAAMAVTIPKGMVSAVLVRVAPGASPEAVSAEITSQVPGTKTLTPNGLLGTISGQLGAVTTLLYGSVLAVSVASVPLLAFISAMVANERRKEIAIIRTLGANRSFILRLMITESATMSILGGLAGIGIALVLLVAFQDLVAFSLKIPFAAPAPTTILSAASVTLLITLAIGGIASIYPAIRVSNSQLYETIRKGES